MTYNADLLREIFEDSLAHLELSLLQAKDWINSRLAGEGIEYSYHQLYRFSRSGRDEKYARRTLDKQLLLDLAKIEFWWNKGKGTPYSQSEIEELICNPPVNYNQPQLSLLELEEVALLQERMNRLSLMGKTALLSATPATDLVSKREYSPRDKLTKSINHRGNKRVTEFTEEEFYRLRNWLTQSLNILGRPGQPRTCAAEQGFQGRIGENLNLLLEGDRNISLSREDYIALSFVLLKIKSWNDFQPVFANLEVYSGDWQGVLLDLRRRRNGQPTSL